MIECKVASCNEEANVWVEGEVFCTEHGIDRAKETDSHTLPIISLSEFMEIEEDMMQFFDPQTVVWSEDGETDIFAFDDVGKRKRLVVEEGISMYREPIVISRCNICEGVAIGYVSKVGGWLARHNHYHNFGEPESDFAGQGQR